MTDRGALITIEGGEGAGKSSSIGVIETFLESRGFVFLSTREPGGTGLGEAVRQWVLEGEHGRLSANVETLLMFAARAHHLDEVIRPALAAGTWVVCDRFTDATYAYQGGGRGADPSLLASLTDAVHDGVQPDLTLLLDAPVAVGMGRIADRPHDHFERETTAFFERVRQAYLARAASEPNRIRVVDAGASIEHVHRAIERELESFLVRFAERKRACG